MALWGKPLVFAVVILVVAYVGIGIVITAVVLDKVLRVGTPAAQGYGWPAPEGPADIGYVGDPRAAFGYDFDAVDIETELGPAPAWLIPADGTRWAIVVHGIGGRRENGYRFLPVLHDAGLPVLMMTYRNDEGAPAAPDGLYTFGLREWTDLDAAVQYALDHGATDIVLVAESMGGGIVGQFLLQSSLADTIAGIVLDAPALDFSAVAANQLYRMHLPLAPVLLQGGMWLSGLLLPVRIGTADTMGVMVDYPGPVFVSHGDGDRLVPVSISDALVARRTGDTEYLRTKADHIGSWKEDPARYDAALSAFLATVP